MTKTKKILSVLLCLAMLFSTVAVGMVVNAENTTIKTYAELEEEYGEDFIYLATVFKKDGEVIDKDAANVAEGDTITCEVYMKSDMPMYSTTQIALVLDNNFFNTGKISGKARTGVTSDYSLTESFDAFYDYFIEEEEVFDLFADCFSAEMLKNEISIMRISLEGKGKPSTGYSKYQIETSFASDEPIYTFSIGVNKNLNGHTTGYIKSFVELYSCNEDLVSFEDEWGIPAYAKICQLGDGQGDVVTYLDVEDVNCNFTASTDKTVTFTDADGTLIKTATVAKGEKLKSNDIPDVTNYDFYKWVDTAGREYTNSEILAKAVTSDITYKVVKASVDLYFYDADHNYITTAHGKKGQPLSTFEGIPVAENYDVYKWTDEVTTVQYTPAELANHTVTSDRTFIGTKLSVDINFVVDSENFATVVGKMGKKLAVSDVPATDSIDGFFKWEDKEGKLYSAADIANTVVTGETTYSAVKGDKEVNVTLDLGEGTIENLPEGATLEDGIITLTAPITGFDISEFTPASEKAFGGWKDEMGNTFDGNFPYNVDNYSLMAVYGEQIVIKALPIEYEVDEEGNPVWVDVGYYTYTGEPTSLDGTSFVDIQKYINSIYDKVEDVVITDKYRDENGEPTVVWGYNVNNVLFTTLDETKNHYGFYANTTIGQLSGAAIRFLSFGEVEGKNPVTTLYLNTAVKYSVEVYQPVIDSENFVVKNPSNPYGLEWKKSSYTQDMFFSAMTIVDGKSRAYYNFITNIYLDDPSSDYIGYIQKDEIKFDYDSTKYKPNFLDSNGNKLFNNEKRVLFKASNTSENEMGVIKVYCQLEDRVYHVGYVVDSAVYAATKTYKYGETISLDDIKEVYTSLSVIGDNTNPEYAIQTTGLYSSGAPVNKLGYELINIYYKNAAGEQVNINDGGVAVIDNYFIDNFKRMPNPSDKEDYYLCFNTEWSGKDYNFDVYYQNANEEWVLLTSKVLSGDETVSYSTVVGLNSELDQIIKNDHPSFLNPATSLATQPGGIPATVFAYDAENDTNTLALYVVYAGTQRYVFVDYNNGFDQDGNINADKTGEGTRYTRLAYMYETLLYDPAFDIATAEEGTKEPALYQLTHGGFSVATEPQQTQKTDANGNKMYEAVQEQAVDEEGNLVYNADGTPKMVNKVDEEGNVVYDMDKPIYDDRKGNTTYRPYRNCEFVGFKVYYVDGVYTKFEDLPDQSEWKEGYNDRNEVGAQHLYTTTILQVQWMADTAFRYRVYDDKYQLSFAKGKDGTKYYWNTRGVPCQKGENVLVQPNGSGVVDKYLILFTITKEEGNGWYFKAISLSKDFLNMKTTSGYIPVILELVKGLI